MYRFMWRLNIESYLLNMIGETIMHQREIRYLVHFEEHSRQITGHQILRYHLAFSCKSLCKDINVKLTIMQFQNYYHFEFASHINLHQSLNFAPIPLFLTVCLPMDIELPLYHSGPCGFYNPWAYYNCYMRNYYACYYNCCYPCGGGCCGPCGGCCCDGKKGKK